MPWKVGGVGDSKACAVGTGSWQSSEGTSWAEVMPGGGLKLIRERMFGSQRWDALNFLQANRICVELLSLSFTSPFRQMYAFLTAWIKTRQCLCLMIYQRVGFFPLTALLRIH